MITFDEPLTLSLLLLLPLLAWVNRRFRARTAYPFNFSNWPGTVFSYTPKPQFGIDIIATALFYLGLGILILAISDPQLISEREIYTNRGNDIIFVVDNSPSMGAVDMGTLNRFDSALQLISQYVANSSNESVGMVLFAQEARLETPITADYSFFQEQLDKMTIADANEDTAIGMGLAIACTHFQYSQALSKIAVLISDGINNSGEISPTAAAELAAMMGIKVYTILMGKNGETELRYQDKQGNMIQGLYRSVVSKETLEEIAAVSGGQLLQAENIDFLESNFEQIASSEKVPEVIRVEIDKLSIYRTMLLFAFFSLLFAFFIKRIILVEFP